MQQFPKKETTPNFSDELVVQSFIQETHDSKTLTQKELDVNRAEQTLLSKRVQLMQSFINELPSTDPQYSMLILQIGMDQVELDELKIRETLLIQKLET